MSPSFNTADYFCYKRRDTAYYRALKVLDLMSFALTHTNLSTRLLYMNVSSLESRCESQVFYIWDEDTTHPVQEDFDFLLLLNIILSIHYTEETFLKDIVCFFLFFFCNFDVFSYILVLQDKRDCSPHKSTVSCLCYMFSVPCPGLLCHFLSPVVFVVVMGSLDHFTDSDLWVSFSKMKESFFESFCSF